MAINKEPLLKKCKYLGISPMVMGVSKDTKRKADQGNRKKLSEYGMHLKEKQKLKFIYGVLEKQFYHYFEIAEKQQGQAGTNLITILESRLDNVVFRMGLATTRRESRQLVTHGHFSVFFKHLCCDFFFSVCREAVENHSLFICSCHYFVIYLVAVKCDSSLFSFAFLSH